MEDYRANSHKAKAEAKEAAEKKVDKVVTGNVKRKKKSEVNPCGGRGNRCGSKCCNGLQGYHQTW